MKDLIYRILAKLYPIDLIEKFSYYKPVGGINLVHT